MVLILVDYTEEEKKTYTNKVLCAFFIYALSQTFALFSFVYRITILH